MQRAAHTPFRDIGESAENQILVWATAAIIPALTSFLWLAFVPPLWHGTDSTSILLWPRGIVPHFPILYPGIVELFEYVVGINPRMLRYLLIVQHILLIISIAYLSSAFRRKTYAVMLSFAALAGTWFASFAHVVITQAIELPFLVLLFGVVLRFYAQGWCVSLLPVLAIAVLGLSLSRHASTILAIVAPIYWLALAGIAYVRRQSVWQYFVYAAVCAGIIGGAFLASVAITQLSCSALNRDCSSVFGRAGYYRIYETYNLIPLGERNAWLEGKTKGLAAETALAYTTMATNKSGMWLETRDTLAKQLPSLNAADRAMNRAFVQFLLSPDKYSLTQMSHEFGGGLYLANSRYMQKQMLGWFIGNTIRVLSDPTLPGDIHAEMRARLGVRGPPDAASLQNLPIDGLFRSYDWYTFHLLTGIAILLFVLVLILVRDARTGALAVSFVVTALTFLFAESAVTVILPHYVQPVNFMMFLGTGICLITLSTWFINSARSFVVR